MRLAACCTVVQPGEHDKGMAYAVSVDGTSRWTATRLRLVASPRLRQKRYTAPPGPPCLAKGHCRKLQWACSRHEGLRSAVVATQLGAELGSEARQASKDDQHNGFCGGGPGEAGRATVQSFRDAFQPDRRSPTLVHCALGA